MQEYENHNSSLFFAVWLRAISAILILSCHYCAQSNHSYIQMISQILNIGVQLFFILSGFLIGYKGVVKPYLYWYKRRFVRIYIPFWIFLFVLASIHILKGLNIFTTHWLMCILGLQGTHVGVWGAEQTWFISVLLLCYLITPWISEIVSRLATKSRIINVCFFTLFSLLPIAFALFEDAWVYTLFTPIIFYTFAFIAGRHYDLRRAASKKHIWPPLFLIIVVFFSGYSCAHFMMAQYYMIESLSHIRILLLRLQFSTYSRFCFKK